MRQLNFDLKTLQARHREGAFLTRRDRAYALNQAADLLHALGFRRLRATGLKRKHVDALVAEWQRRGLAVGTVKNRMSALRWWAERIGRPGVVGTNAAHGIGERRYVTNEDRSRRLDAQQLARVTDAHVRMALQLQAAFGLRREEAIKFTPAYAELHISNASVADGCWRAVVGGAHPARFASVAFDELGQAVLGEEVVDRLAEERLEGGVAVGGEAPELAADLGGEVGGDARLARACGCCRGPRSGTPFSTQSPGVRGVTAAMRSRVPETGVRDVRRSPQLAALACGPRSTTSADRPSDAAAQASARDCWSCRPRPFARSPRWSSRAEAARARTREWVVVAGGRPARVRVCRPVGLPAWRLVDLSACRGVRVSACRHNAAPARNAGPRPTT